MSIVYSGRSAPRAVSHTTHTSGARYTAVASSQIASLTGAGLIFPLRSVAWWLAAARYAGGRQGAIQRRAHPVARLPKVGNPALGARRDPIAAPPCLCVHVVLCRQETLLGGWAQGSSSRALQLRALVEQANHKPRAWS